MKNLFKPVALTLSLAIGATVASAEDLVIRWGTEAGYKPFAFKTADGELTGFDIEIGNAICEELNATCSWQEHEFDALIAALNANKFDALLASMTDTDKRRRAIDFTSKYYKIPATFVGRADAGLDDGDGLAGKTVGVQRSTIMEDFLRNERKDVNVKTYPTQDEIWLDLVAGRLDAGMGVKLQIVEGFLNTDQGEGFALFGKDYDDPKYFGYGSAIGVRKSDSDLRDAISGAILALRENGKYAEINDKYFDFDIYGE